MPLFRKKIVADIRRRWGRPRGENFHPLIAAYADANADTPWHRLSAQTLSDLDFKALFTLLDHTNSRIGQQYLYERLITPTNDDQQLKPLDSNARWLTNNPGRREEIQLLLRRLDHPDALHVSRLLDIRQYPRPRWLRLAVLDTLLVSATLLLSLVKPVLLIWLLLPFAVNLMLHLRNKNNTFVFLRSFPQLDLLIRITHRLSGQNLPFDDTGVSASLGRLKTFQRKFRRLAFGQTGNNEFEQIYYWLLEVLKAFFLVEVHTFYSLIRILETRHADIHRLFQYIGSIDQALSVASLRAGGQPTCTPSLTPSAKQLTLTEGYHPLIDNCVVNTLHIEGRGILITGSNMSGKTTFLRTVGVNALLAQSLYTCFAKAYEAPPLRLYSSIRIDDNLLEGKSYYFEEVNVMHQLVTAAAHPEATPGASAVSDGTSTDNLFPASGAPASISRNLYLLDEVFRGTNTVERIAAAQAILSYLDRQGHLVIVSTHDIELSEKLTTQYDLYHFEETIDGQKLVFDHHLKPGPLRTRNAIRILELAGFPPEIIRDAFAASGALSPPQDGLASPAEAPGRSGRATGQTYTPPGGNAPPQ